VVVHPRRAAILGIPHQRIRRQRHDRRAPPVVALCLGARIAAVAAKPSSSGMWQSISTTHRAVSHRHELVYRVGLCYQYASAPG
jgi:hypothetical protein